MEWNTGRYPTWTNSIRDTRCWDNSSKSLLVPSPTHKETLLGQCHLWLKCIFITITLQEENFHWNLDIANGKFAKLKFRLS